MILEYSRSLFSIQSQYLHKLLQVIILLNPIKCISLIFLIHPKNDVFFCCKFFFLGFLIEWAFAGTISIRKDPHVLNVHVPST